ncbi:hypothetical protein ABZ477_11240 [Microbacterium sp. NPDC019599]|uniref:hypothetical protein n=1 Tax=Microbacterium sp. NPDC019599 TaxID=3154690 RepID=UPI0033D04E9B
MNRRITAMTIVAVALFGITGCTASPTDSPSAGTTPRETAAPSDDAQSVAEACALVQDTIQQASESFADAAKEDPSAVVDAMTSAADDLAAAAVQITNADVAAVLPGVQDMFAQTAEIMQGIVDGDVSKIGELAEIGDTFHDTVQQFQDLCSAE